MNIDINQLITLKDWDSLNTNINNFKYDSIYTLSPIELSTFSFDIWNLLKDWLRLSDSLEIIVPKLHKLLSHCFSAAEQKISKEDFYWLFGYMLQVGPENFMDDNLDYLTAEKIGLNFLTLAANDYNNPIAKVFLNSTAITSEDILHAETYLSNLFNNTSSIYIYFRDILELNKN